MSLGRITLLINDDLYLPFGKLTTAEVRYLARLQYKWKTRIAKDLKSISPSGSSDSVNCMLASHPHRLTHKINITKLKELYLIKNAVYPKREKETHTDLEVVYNKQGGED